VAYVAATMKSVVIVNAYILRTTVEAAEVHSPAVRIKGVALKSEAAIRFWDSAPGAISNA